MDEAASRLRMQVDSKPEELDALDREILQKQIEAEALKQEKDLASQDRLAKLVKELRGLEERSAEMTARWKAERDKLKGAAEIKDRLDQARGELENVKRQGNLQRAGELAYGIIPGLEKELEEAEKRGSEAMVEEAVTPEQIAEVVERWTGIPVDRMLEGERDKLIRMEQELAKRVIGQLPAVEAVSNAVRRARAGLERPEPAAGLVPVPRADRRRQDRADQGAGGVPVRRRPGDGADRHERVHGEALGRPADRRAAGLCRLRRGRGADRGGAAAAVSGDPVRRGREGAPGRVQRAAAGARRRAADRRAGAHGRLQEHADHPDLEPRQPGAVARCPRGRTRRRRATR